MEELFELELDEPFDEEFELELLDELELEFDELLDDEFELELLEELELELDELLPATMKLPSLWLSIVGDGRSASAVPGEYSLPCAAVPARTAMPATRVDLNFQCLVMIVTPFPNQTGSSGPVWETGDLHLYSMKTITGNYSGILPEIVRNAFSSSSADIGAPTFIAAR